MTNDIFATFIKVLVGILIAWLLFLVFAPKPSQAPDNRLYTNEVYDSLNIELAYAREEKKMLRDSLFGAQVEKGRIEVELNRSQSQVDNLMNKTSESITKRDTPQIVQNCDSLVKVIRGKFVPVFTEYRNVVALIDSMRVINDHVVDSIQSIEWYFRKRLTDDLVVQQHSNSILRSEATKAKKRTRTLVIVSLLTGFAAGIFINK